VPKLAEILKQPEGRKLELKETLPSNADLAKTIIAFANDAGGEMYVGIKDNPLHNQRNLHRHVGENVGENFRTY
jgi:predicted HTH transcriptional regulator